MGSKSFIHVWTKLKETVLFTCVYNPPCHNSQQGLDPMPAFLVATVRVKDPEKFQQYSEKAGPTFAPFGGELVLRGASQEVLVGQTSPHASAIIQFPDMKAIRGWFASDAYSALGHLRDAACDMTLVSYETPA
jgi:uncharacterized protein (DUF1330 family)